MCEQSTTAFSLTVGCQCGGVTITRVSTGQGKGRAHGVKCNRCGVEYEMTESSLRKRHRFPREGCLACRKNNTRDNRVPARKGCRVCDDCPALRPASGCPACGEPGRRAA